MPQRNEVSEGTFLTQRVLRMLQSVALAEARFAKQSQTAEIGEGLEGLCTEVFSKA